MSLTPNYSFIIPTGSDAVNLLTQCYPNFTSLDSILKPIQESGVTVATDTKVGTVHQLVRTDSSCNIFRFIATGNYVLGDTFTVDGASVTATAMDGTSIPDGAFVINQSVVCILNNLVLTVLIAGKETTSLPATAITYDNTVSGLTATNAQDAIDEVYASIPTITEHGLYELWVNPTPTSMTAGNVVINSDKDIDSLIIEMGSSLKYAEFGLTYSSISFSMVNNAIQTQHRLFSATKVGTTITVTFGGGSFTRYPTYGSAGNETASDSQEVPVRILGLVHNN